MNVYRVKNRSWLASCLLTTQLQLWSFTQHTSYILLRNPCTLSFKDSTSNSFVRPLSHTTTPKKHAMLPYRTIQEVEEAHGRALTFAEKLWFRYSAHKPDYILHYHNIIFLMLLYTLAPLPYVFIGLGWFKNMDRYKIQPKVKASLSNMLKCYKNVMASFLVVVGPLQVISYPTIQKTLETIGSIGYSTQNGDTRTSIHRIHHEYAAPIGLAAPYAHWAEILILGVPAFLAPTLVPCHIVTYWLWFILRQMEAIETHSGYNFPWSPSKYIPFYGGAEYHHYVGEQSQSNFASEFTYCDYIYGTDKGYRYRKQALEMMAKQRHDD